MGEQVHVADDLGLFKFKGVFDLDGMLRMIQGWIVHKQYDFYETLHKAKSPELELEWHGERKVAAYYKYHIYISFKFFDRKEVEIEMPDGSKKKMVDARFWIKFDGAIERDFEGTWDASKNRWHARLKKFFEASTKREFLSEHAAELVDEIRGLMAQTKSYLGMEGV